MAGLIGRRRGSDDFEPSGEINVTPMIDVMLVLLLVFMIAAPISTVNVDVDLPSSTAKPVPPPDHPITVSIQRDLSLYIGDRRVAPFDLAVAMKQAGATSGSTIYLRIDKQVVYGETLSILDSLRHAGYTKVALVGIEAH